MDNHSALKSQYHSGLAMLKETIEQCADDLWLSGEHPRQFWRIAYHGLFFTHLYLQPCAEDFRPWEHHRDECESLSNLPWPPFDMPKVAEPYTKQELLDYLLVLDSMVDEGVDRLNLEAPECGFPWYKLNKLEHQLMSIRHLQQHIGQLSERIYATGADLKWVG